MLPLGDVQWVEVPKYDELSVTNIYPRFKADALVAIYLPDRLPKGRLPDRSYFYNVLHTVYPEYVKELVRVAGDHRHQAAAGNRDDGIIRVSDDWWKKLNDIPFVSCKSIVKSNIIRT